ncbi:PEPxxWA-CTERM sorting domain-containing protein [Sandaracinobacteroides hominis]|uniref:PEPxxWA-CTERM sorting domain-containing protein n=1 Tax=Sandaracinobacteroides hominis TaxID=2780086 RepID=UPI0018F46DF8|nr:PEPxxWA-CTERM sorting domain-containing protein [Sandaracinobacteroides hominis]
MKVAHILAAAAFAAFSTASSAAVLYTQAAPTGALESPNSVDFNFNAPAGAGLASFTLHGYASLDGAGNGYTDIFTVSLNGTDILQGSWNLGGGGNDVVWFAPVGSSISVSSPGGWAGGTGLFSVPLALTAGSNTLTLSYSGNGQGLGDEGWGISNLTVAGVPEPATWVMLIAGFGMVGFARRRGPIASTLA